MTAPQCGVAGKPKLTGEGEDPDPIGGGVVSRLEEKCRLREVEPAGELEHPLGGHPLGLGHHGKGIPQQRLGPEHVDQVEGSPHRPAPAMMGE